MDSTSLVAIELGLDPTPRWYIPPKPSRWIPSHIGKRATMCARRWEGLLFTPAALERLCDMPCCDDLDSRLIIAANDWIRILQKLINLEVQHPDHKVDEYCEPYGFSRLYAMVHELHDRVYKYSRGVPQIRQTPKHHKTTRPGRPESDVTQARQTMAKLLQMEFGTWIEDITMGGWLNAYPGATFTHFAFDPLCGVLSWIDHDAEDDESIPYQSQVLDMIFGKQSPTEDDLEVDDEIEPRSVFSWVLRVPDDVSFSSDGVMGERGLTLHVEAPNITSDMTVSIKLDFTANNTIMSSHNFENIPIGQLSAQPGVYHESLPQSASSDTDDDEQTDSYQE